MFSRFTTSSTPRWSTPHWPSAGVTFKERIYTPFVTLCMFLSQVLDPDHSCRAAVARLIVWLAVNDRKPCSPETNSYCDARQRLPLEVIVELVHQTARKIEAGASDQWLWKGRTGLNDRRQHQFDARHPGEPACLPPGEHPEASAWDSQ